VEVSFHRKGVYMGLLGFIGVVIILSSIFALEYWSRKKWKN